MSALERLSAAVQLASLVSAGRYVDAGRLALALGVDLIPIGELPGYLGDESAARARAIADLAELAKVGA